MTDKENHSLDDRVWGIEGSFSHTEDAKGFDTGQTMKWVYYYPEIEAFRNPFKYFWYVFRGRGDPVRLPEAVPEKHILEGITPPKRDAPGAPEKKTVIRSLEDGKAPYTHKIGEEVDLAAEIANKELENQKTSSIQEEARAINQKLESEEEEDRSNRGRRMMDRGDFI